MPDSLCPYCETRLVSEARPYTLHGVSLGTFDVLVCPSCRRVFHPRETSLRIEAAAKAKGIAFERPSSEAMPRSGRRRVPGSRA